MKTHSRNGNLEIVLRKESVAGKNYTAGGIISKRTFVYGYYEARFKTPPAEGWHTAFWSMRHIRVYQHPKYREAEAAVRAEVLRPLPPLPPPGKKAKPGGPKPEDLN